MTIGPKRLFLLDAYALIYRSYYAFLKNPRINSKGENTSAIFGFLNTVEDLLRRENPTHLAVAFDPGGKTFRHEAYEAYKAQREETPETIRWSIPYIKRILEAYRIPILEVPRFEADDVIGTVAKKAEEKGFDVYMMTPDKDYGQLVSDHSFIYKPRFGSSEFDVLGPNEVCEKYGLTMTCQVIDLLSLMGDASDNIPGCPGVGKVYAQKLIAQFGNIDNLLSKTDELKGSIKEKIENNKEQILFSRFLATIKTDVPVEFNENDLVMVPRDEEKVIPIFEELEFRSWINRKSATANYKNITPPQNQPEDLQYSLWDNKGHTNTISSPKQKKNDVDSPDLFSSFFQPENTTESTAEEKYDTLQSLKERPHHYYILDNEDKINDFLSKISVCNFFCFDTETTSIEAMTAELVGISFSFKKNEAYYLPCPTEKNTCLIFLQKFKFLFENPDSLKIGQNIKYDILLLNHYDIHVRGPLFDTLIAHYLIQPELSHSLDYLAEIYLHYRNIPIEDLIGPKGKNQINMRNVPVETIADYACEDADITFQLKEILEKDIERENLHYLFYEVELPLIYVLADMEATGISIDTEALKEYSKQLTEQMNTIEQEIYSIAGVSINLNSSKQVGELLFDKLKIIEKVKKTKKAKQYSTSEEILKSLKDKHPIVGKLLEYRGLKKLLSTYIDALPLLINPQTGKIHTSFNQAVTATGRLSSSNPNLQNIPIRDELGKEIRKVFSAGKGEIFLSADYSQIELRIMAHLSGDEHMIEAFQKDQDIHAATAAKIFKVSLNEVTSDMRRKAKTANFGIIYGISNFGLAERMDVSRTEAKTLIDGYFETYPKIKAYMDFSIQKARENLWVETIYHRKRYLPDIVSHNAVVRNFAERNAINAPIQGTAADIIKIAMVRIFQRIEKEALKTKMILQVHDELNFIVPVDEIDQVKKIVKQEMESAARFSVPLKADIGTGKNWLEAH